MSTDLSRRSIAKGAVWSVPAVSVAASAPAMAASSPVTVGGTICQQFYGSGSINNQTMDVYLGISSTPGTIPAGTTITWSFTMDTSTTYATKYAQVPMTNYSANNLWQLTTSPAAGTNATSFTATWTALSDVTAASVACTAKLVWNDTYLVSPGTTMTMTSAASGTSVTPSPAGLKWQVPQRYSTSTRPSQATEFISKSGAQACYPGVNYSAVSGANAAQGTNGSACTATGGNNSSTLYPDGTCAKVNITSGQASVPEKC